MTCYADLIHKVLITKFSHEIVDVLSLIIPYTNLIDLTFYYYSHFMKNIENILGFLFSFIYCV